jgi:hypothetical protein
MIRAAADRRRQFAFTLSGLLRGEKFNEDFSADSGALQRISGL